MAAWIEQYRQEERSRNFLEDEESSRRRMVELMLGPFIAGKPTHHQLHGEQPTTLELLPAPTYSCSPVIDNMGCTHIELEPEMPLPSGWEKCLNLKTGSIYYLNRTTGATSVSDPRNQASHHKGCNGGDLSSSPTTSELTAEASNEVVFNSISAKHQRSLNINEKSKPVKGNDGSDLDLNLSLHVGLCLSPNPPSRDVGVLTLHPPSSISPSENKASTNANASSACSSSSSTSSPISASLAFSQTILSSKELSRQHSPQEKGSFFKQIESNQVTRFAMNGSSFYGDFHHSVSDYAQETRLKQLAESEDLSSAAATMVTVACANCLMFVMLSRSNPKCPRCGTNCPEQMEFPQRPLKRAKLGFSF